MRQTEHGACCESNNGESGNAADAGVAVERRQRRID
jgi:hypothetical protein